VSLDTIKTTMDYMFNNPYAFFDYLKLCKGGGSTQLVAEITPHDRELIRSNEYYDTLSFKTFICELVYNAINLFPQISKYTISCKNEQGECQLIFADFSEQHENNSSVMSKFVGIDWGYSLELSDIKHLYSHNRHENVDLDTVNVMVALMCMGGTIPRVSTFYEVNKDFYRSELKFKC
jgi:hypothetical protein